MLNLSIPGVNLFGGWRTWTNSRGKSLSITIFFWLCWNIYKKTILNSISIFSYQNLDCFSYVVFVRIFHATNLDLSNHSLHRPEILGITWQLVLRCHYVHNWTRQSYNCSPSAPPQPSPETKRSLGPKGPILSRRICVGLLWCFVEKNTVLVATRYFLSHSVNVQ